MTGSLLRTPSASGPTTLRPLRAGVLLSACLLAVACARSSRESRDGAISLRGGPTSRSDAAAIYQRAGLLSATDPVPFTGWTRFLAGPEPDSTLALVALSFPARAFAFVYDGRSYRARYAVTVEFRRGSETVRRFGAQETVRVSSYRETMRDEESVIFQQFGEVAPGAYTLLVAVRDSNSGRESSAALRVTVPRFDSLTVAPPIPVYQALPRRSRRERPRLVANARATAVLARDSVVRLYVESYGAARAPLRLRVVGAEPEASGVVDLSVPEVADEGTPVQGRVIDVPLSRVPMGLSRLELTGMATPNAAAAAPTSVFVGLGEGLVVASFDEVLDFLKWFAPPERLRELGATPPEERPAAWSRFLKETDPEQGTLEHEALREYLHRLETANTRFREGVTPGWRTDRGMVFAALGEPDRVSEPFVRGEAAPGPRTLIWEYDARRLRISFVDRTGLGEWRLTSESESEFRTAVRRRDG